MSAKATSIWTILLGLGLILMSIYTINNYSKDPTSTTFKKIVVDVFGLVFIVGGIAAIWTSSKALAA